MGGRGVREPGPRRPGKGPAGRAGSRAGLGGRPGGSGARGARLGAGAGSDRGRVSLAGGARPGEPCAERGWGGGGGAGEHGGGAAVGARGSPRVLGAPAG